MGEHLSGPLDTAPCKTGNCIISYLQIYGMLLYKLWLRLFVTRTALRQWRVCPKHCKLETRSQCPLSPAMTELMPDRERPGTSTKKFATC